MPTVSKEDVRKAGGIVLQPGTSMTEAELEEAIFKELTKPPTNLEDTEVNRAKILDWITRLLDNKNFVIIASGPDVGKIKRGPDLPTARTP